MKFFAILLLVASVQAQTWKQTWGSRGVGPDQAGFVGQGKMVVIPGTGPGVGPFVWENASRGLITFSDAGYFYSWQNGGNKSYPWGSPLFWCGTNSDNYAPIVDDRWLFASNKIGPSDTILQSQPAATVDARNGGARPLTGPGSYLQVDDELVEFSAYDPVKRILTIKRGALGTTATTHNNETSFWDDFFGYACPSPQVHGHSPVPGKDVAANFQTVPAARHPNGDIEYDSTHDVIWLGGGIRESFSNHDLWYYCHQTSTGFCAGKSTLNYVTSTVAPRQESVMIWDPDQQVLGRFGGTKFGSPNREVWLFCTTPNPKTGCTKANRMNSIQAGVNSSYISNPAAGPTLAAMRGVYDTQHHAFVLWGISGRIYILQWNSKKKWKWILPTQTGAKPPGENRPAITWDSKRNRVLLLVYKGSLYSGSWDGDSTWTWDDLHIAPGPTWIENDIAYPAIGYWPDHDALIVSNKGYSLGAWELALGTHTTSAQGAWPTRTNPPTQRIQGSSESYSQPENSDHSTALAFSTGVGSGSVVRSDSCSGNCLGGNLTVISRSNAHLQPMPTSSHLLLTNLIVQEALLPGTRGVTRTSDPVTVGIPLADSANIKSVNQLGCTGTPACQFRPLARGSDGNLKWVLFDFQDSVKAGRLDSSVSVTTGTGSVGGNATTCNGHQSADLACDGSTIKVTTGACVFLVRKANFVGVSKAICGSKTIIDDSSAKQDGFVIMGPANPSDTVTTCTFSSTCTNAFKSHNDSNSTCGIEENGPVRAALRCTASLIDASGNTYMHVTVRLHFYVGKSSVRAVVSLRNADLGPANSLATATKGFQAFEWRMKTSVNGNATFTTGRSMGSSYRATLTPSDQGYLYQAFSTSLLECDAISKSTQGLTHLPIARIHPLNCQQANAINNQDGINDSALAASFRQAGYEIHRTGQKAVIAAYNRFSAGWADCADSTGMGLAIGHYQMAAYWPKSLQYFNGCADVTIGIWPDQALSSQAGGQIYYQEWTTYSIHDVWLDFHATALLSAETEFHRFESPLIGRAPIAYYNSTRSLPYPLVDPVREDNYWRNLFSAKGQGFTKLNDFSPPVYRDKLWAAGGTGNQEDYRYGYLVDRWLSRGLTGNYLAARHWYRFFAEQVLPRADGFEWRTQTTLRRLEQNYGYPSASWSTNSQRGLCIIGATGCYPEQEHAHYFSVVFGYYLTGDEDLNEQLKSGLSDRYLNTSIKLNLPGTRNVSWNSRAVGSNMMDAAALWMYLADQGDHANEATALSVVDNLFSQFTSEPCVVDAHRNHWPPGCAIRFESECAECQNGRGVSRYRGVDQGPNDEELNGFRCGLNNVMQRCVKTFMQGIAVQPLLFFAWANPSWTHYQSALDLAYGIGKGTTSEGYVSPYGLVYEWALDAPNNMKWGINGVTDGADDPAAFLYAAQGQYTGTSSEWGTSFNQQWMYRMGTNGQNINTYFGGYGMFPMAGVESILLDPPSAILQTVPLSKSYDAVTGEWRLAWTPPLGVIRYYLKQSDNNTIVDWIGWNPTTNLPIGDVRSSSNWFAAAPTATQPSVNATSITIPAARQANFMLKALARSAQ